MTSFNKTNKATNFWPIKQFRFETAKHPALPVVRGRPFEIKISHNERQMLQGLARILQCDEKTALRIACYEFLKVDLCHTSLIEEATSVSANRKFKMKVSISAEMQRKMQAKATSIGVSLKAVYRLALIALCKGIRNESIKRLTNSPRIGQQKLAEEWKKTGDNSRKPGTLGALRQAHHHAYEEAKDEGRELDELIYKQRGEFVNQNGLQYLIETDSYGNSWMDTHAVDTIMRATALEALTPAQQRQYRIDEYLDLGLSQKEAEECMAEEDAEAEGLSDEELEELEALDDDDEFPLMEIDEEMQEAAKERMRKMTEDMLRDIDNGTW